MADLKTFTGVTTANIKTLDSVAIAGVKTVNGLTVVAGYDSDAQAFFTAYSITDTTQKDAVNNLVLDLKSASLWGKFIAIYPFVGGSASTHAGNLVNPGTYDLTFNGGWTHASTGALPNGSTGYADCGFSANGALSQNDTHISAYSRTLSTSTACLMGNTNDAHPQLNIFPTFGSALYLRCNSAGTSSITSNTDSQGLFISNRVSSTESRNQHKTTQYVQTANSTGLATSNTVLGRQGASQYGVFEYAWASAGSGLSDSEMTDLETIVTDYETALSRNV